MRELLEYKYFEQAPMSDHEREISKPYKSDIDYAFFAVKFGWTRSQYEELTEMDRLFILKEIERQTVRDQEIMQQTFELAISNAMRKRGARYNKFWKRKFSQESLPITMDEAKKVKEALASMPTLAEVLAMPKKSK